MKIPVLIVWKGLCNIDYLLMMMGGGGLLNFYQK